jgi:hypothetical protein
MVGGEATLFMLLRLIFFLEVTHPVVAQANPHVHLFFFAPRGSAGKPVAHRKNKGTIQLALELLPDWNFMVRVAGKLLAFRR